MIEWKLMGEAPTDGTAIFAVDIAGDVLPIFYSDEDEQWLTWDDAVEPFGPVMWHEMGELPDEDDPLWGQAVEEWEQYIAAEEEKWDSRASFPRGV